MSAIVGPRGCNLHVESSHDAPLVWIEVAVIGGAAGDAVGLEGFTRHAALLARRGAGARDRAALDDAVDGLGASIDVSVSRDATTFSGVALTRNVDRLVELFADVLARPQMIELEHEKLLRETGFLLDELRDDDGDLAARFFDRACAPGHPYGRTSIGTAPSLAALGGARAALIEHHHRATVPANLIVGIAGDVDQARAVAITEALLSGLPDSAAPAPPPLTSPPPPSGRRLIIVDKPERTQSQIRLGHLGPRYGSDDAIALTIVETAFGGTFSARLMQEIRVKRGWSYGAGCALRRSRADHWFEIHLAPSIDVTADALALTVQLYEQLREGGLTADEIDFSKSYLLGSMPFHLATARQRMGVAVKNAVFGLPDDYVARLPGRIEAVTSGEIQSVIDRWIRPRDLTSVIVATASEVVDALARTGAADGAAEVVAYDSY